MTQKKSKQGSIYHILLKESVEGSRADWLGDITLISQEKGGSLLVGKFIDQPALRGFVDQLWNLNFTVLSVEKKENKNDEEHPQAHQKGG